MSLYPIVRIEFPDGGPQSHGTKIFVDDVEQRGVRKATLEIEVGKAVTLTLEQFPDVESVEGPMVVRRIIADVTAISDRWQKLAPVATTCTCDALVEPGSCPYCQSINRAA